jgi:D-3-phosphoglycerate dehydrogenase
MQSIAAPEQQSRRGATSAGKSRAVNTGSRSARTQHVAILGTRWADFSIEKQVLTPLGVEIRSGDGTSSEAVAQEAGGADVILAGSSPRFDAPTLKRLTCRGIVRYGVGTETIDLDAAARRGMWVAFVPDYGVEAVSIHAITLVLAGLRRLVEADALVKAGDWGLERLRPLHSPSALTAGVIGFGRIGSRVASHLSALGFRVLGHDPYAPIQEGLAESAPLGELVRAADVISLHAPHHRESGPLIGKKEIEQMKPGAVLVNTARGALIDHGALVDGLATGRPGIAALDVYPQEPPDVSIFQPVINRTILTPHMAWYTEESEADLRLRAAEEARRILIGEPPMNVAASPLDESP